MPPKWLLVLLLVAGASAAPSTTTTTFSTNLTTFPTCPALDCWHGFAFALWIDMPMHCWCASRKCRNKLVHMYNGNPPQAVPQTNPRAQQFAGRSASARDLSRTPPGTFAPATPPATLPATVPSLPGQPVLAAAPFDMQQLVAVIQTTVQQSVSMSVDSAMRPYTERLDNLTGEMQSLNARVAALEKKSDATVPASSDALLSLQRKMDKMERDALACKVMFVGFADHHTDETRKKTVETFVQTNLANMHHATEFETLSKGPRDKRTRTGNFCVTFPSSSDAQRVLTACSSKHHVLDGAEIRARMPRTTSQLERNKALRDAEQAAKTKAPSGANISIDWKLRRILVNGNAACVQDRQGLGGTWSASQPAADSMQE